jgi:hypothetical protein
VSAPWTRLLAEKVENTHNLLCGETGFAVHPFQLEILHLQGELTPPESLTVEHISGADSHAKTFVGVTGADSALSGADLLFLSSSMAPSMAYDMEG